MEIADTIKVRMQLSRRARAPGVCLLCYRPRSLYDQTYIVYLANGRGLQAPKRGFITTGKEIVKRETALGLYKGLGAVLTGIVPKMATRFTSYEWYKQMLADQDGNVNSKATFLCKFELNSIWNLFALYGRQ
jgi:solute carrier family 25 citrate transporter 1